MMRRFLLALTLLLTADPTNARRADFCQDCARDHRGRIERSHQAIRQFKLETGFPHGRPGYHIDHMIPLACGGADRPENMQWLSVEEKRIKDRTERRGCYVR